MTHTEMAVTQFGRSALERDEMKEKKNKDGSKKSCERNYKRKCTDFFF